MDQTSSAFIATTGTNQPGHPRRASTTLGAMTPTFASAMRSGKVAAMGLELPPGTNFILKTLLTFGAGLLIAGLL